MVTPALKLGLKNRLTSTYLERGLQGVNGHDHDPPESCRGTCGPCLDGHGKVVGGQVGQDARVGSGVAETGERPLEQGRADAAVEARYPALLVQSPGKRNRGCVIILNIIVPYLQINLL